VTITFDSVDGTSWGFEGEQRVYATQGSLQALYEPQMDLVLDQRVGTDGAVKATSRQPPRRIMLSMFIDGAGDPLPVWASLLSSFAAGGIFRHRRLDGTTRVMRQVTLESTQTTSALGHTAHRGEVDIATVTLQALDPWWYGSPQSSSLLFGASSTPWNAPVSWSPALPWSGGATSTIDVVGDAGATPYVDIVGPVSDMSVAITSTTTTRRVGWRSQYPLAAGQRLTVDHRWSSRGPRLAQSVAVNWALLTPSSRLFVLPKGRSNLVAGLVGSTSSTQATIYWEPRWFTP
jgi:hypothetical protein